MAKTAAPPLAVTMGEPAGIGPELILRAWAQRKDHDLPPFYALADAAQLTDLADRLAVDVPVCPIERPTDTASTFGHALPVVTVALIEPVIYGAPTAANAAAVIAAIDAAVDHCRDGLAAGLVTCPIQKSSLYQAGFKHPGHTEYLAHRCGVATPPVMMLCCPGLRTVPVTIHVALRAAINALTTDLIVEHGRIAAEALASDYGVAAPRLAVAGLNPHAGEDGNLGTEDRDIVAPAVERLRAASIDAHGPMPADTMFAPALRPGYDVALCMYHDQALIPVKALDLDAGVNVTLGLPIVRTSPDHGTALDIAGTGAASASSLIAAIREAAGIARHRQIAA